MGGKIEKENDKPAKRNQRTFFYFFLPFFRPCTFPSFIQPIAEREREREAVTALALDRQTLQTVLFLSIAGRGAGGRTGGEEKKEEKVKGLFYV